METNRKTGIIIGILYIIGTVSGILSGLLTRFPSDYFSRIAAAHYQFTLGALFILIMGFSLALIPIILYPILKKQNKILALGYVVFRGALETFTYITLFISVMLLLKLGQHYAGNDNAQSLDNASFLVTKFHDLNMLIVCFVFSIGALLFYTLLYQSKLIPRWLSVWGIIAIVLHLTTGFLILFELQTEFSIPNMLMNFPIFLQEMVMAVWLIIKGFNLEFINN